MFEWLVIKLDGLFVCATIVEKNDSNFKIHFDGWSNKWDCYIDYEKEFFRFVQADSIWKRPAHRFKSIKKGDFIDINPVVRHLGWCVGEIRKLCQVQVCYQCKQNLHLYWDDLDNEQVFAPFASKTSINNDNNNNDDIIRQEEYLNMMAMKNKNDNDNQVWETWSLTIFLP